MNLTGYRTYIGLVVAAIPTLAGLFGYEVSPQFNDQFVSLAEELLTIVGLAIAFYGRAKSETPGWLAKKK